MAQVDIFVIGEFLTAVSSRNQILSCRQFSLTVVSKIQFDGGFENLIWRWFRKSNLTLVSKIQFDGGFEIQSDGGFENAIWRRFRKFNLTVVSKIQFGGGFENSIWRRFRIFGDGGFRDEVATKKVAKSEKKHG